MKKKTEPNKNQTTIGNRLICHWTVNSWETPDYHHYFKTKNSKKKTIEIILSEDENKGNK